MKAPLFLSLALVVDLVAFPAAAQIRKPVQSAEPTAHLSVELWADLANLDGRGINRSAYVRELLRAGSAVFVPTASLPAWASGPDITGLSIGDSSGTGKWIHRWAGPVDFARLGPQHNGSAADERNALQALVDAGFDEIYVPEGVYDGYLNRTVAAPLRLIGAGRDKTIFVGDGIPGHSAFLLDSSLTLENLQFRDQTRLVLVNPSRRQNLGTIRLELDNVFFDMGGASPNTAAIQSLPAGPLSGTEFFLDMRRCYFRVSSEMDHISARSGLLGHIDRCTFEGGKRGVANIPSDAGDFSGTAANEFSKDFRISDCEFTGFSYAGSSDSYHLQVAGKRWIVSGCRFDALSGSGVTSSGNLYSNLQDSHFIGCSFEDGGSFHLFFKGAERMNPSTSPTDGNGWGNTVIGCTFDGAKPLQVSQIYMNVKEQRFIGCSFRDYETYAITANQQGTNSDHLVIDDCDFSSARSPSAIRLVNGGRNIRISNSTFADITGTQGARFGVLVLDPVAGQQTTSFDDLSVENCAFRNNAWSTVYFYGNTTPYAVNRFRFVRNTVNHPAGRGFLAGTAATIRGCVLEDNYISVGSDGWNVPAGSPQCDSVVLRSVDNTWVDNGGTSLPPNSVAFGIATGTVVCNETALTNGSVLAIPDNARLIRIAAGVGAVNVSLQDGAYDAQRITLVGASDTNSVTIPDAGNAALGSARSLGAGDTLTVLWVAAAGKWCELSFSDN